LSVNDNNLFLADFSTLNATTAMMRQLKITVAITSRGSEALERYLQDISKEEMVSTDEEVELAKRIRQGDKNALERLVKANLRFVVSVAKQYQGQGLELTDLINEGNVGLINAAMKFDETRGFKFISYAVWWVRQSILQALADKSRLVRLPLNQIGYVSKVNHFYHDFMQKNNRAPSLDEVADALGMEKSKVNAALLTSGKHISMNAPLIDDEDSCLLDLLTNDDKGNADSSLISDSLKEEVHHALDLLPERESQVIRMYFGINTPELSLEEIGEKLNLSRERVRQIKEKALTLLRNAQIGSVLKEYL
jgi:RNA polymerase primary sigma factor